MSTLTERRTIVVSAAVRANANIVARVIDPDSSAADSIATALSASGGFPPTHYIASVMLTPATAQLLDGKNATLIHQAAQSAAAANGRSYTLTLVDVQALCLAATVVTTGVAETMAAMGLKYAAEAAP